MLMPASSLLEIGVHTEFKLASFATVVLANSVKLGVYQASHRPSAAPELVWAGPCARITSGADSWSLALLGVRLSIGVDLLRRRRRATFTRAQDCGVLGPNARAVGGRFEVGESA